MSANPVTAYSLSQLVDRAAQHGIEASQRLDATQRSQKGQFFTPPLVARFMASLFQDPPQEVRLLDAGAGVGSLTAAFVENACCREARPNRIAVAAYENDPQIVDSLQTVLTDCEFKCKQYGIAFSGQVFPVDFIKAGVEIVRPSMFPGSRQTFNRAILNPPYKKIRSDSEHRRWLRLIGVETVNLYTAFLALAVKLLEPGGELVAITPRSFCNGPYYKPFRKLFLESVAICRIHVYETRDKAFAEDDVLQENIIFHAIKQKAQGKVIISSSQNPSNENMILRQVDYEQVVNPNDPEMFIHIATNGMDQSIVDRMRVFTHSLADLGIEVSTGRVVDFRAREFLKAEPEPGTVPLIYPLHFDEGYVTWPRPGSKKPNAILAKDSTAPLLLPSGFYVLTRRFSSKEEPRRVVAAIYDPERVPAAQVGFENHLNVYHQHDAGLPVGLAKGLAIFLNSKLLDLYFRQFSGHTQVNATDLRALRYPSQEALGRLGSRFGEKFPSQEQIDGWLEEEIRQMTGTQTPNPVAAQRKIEQAVEILKALGLPRGQHNERSGLTLLALLELRPEMSWSEATAPLMGITPIMEFAQEHYGREYAPNTRETFRRQSMHQFVDAALAVPNPDNPDRPINSPKYCYQIEPTALKLLRTYGTHKWEESLSDYLAKVGTLQERYARKRQERMVSVTFQTRSEMVRHIRDISWETEVWINESPTHLIHFDGDRFLEPHQ